MLVILFVETSHVNDGRVSCGTMIFHCIKVALIMQVRDSCPPRHTDTTSVDEINKPMINLMNLLKY